MGITRDVDKAFRLANAGVQTGCPHCKGALACCLLHGWGTKKDVDLALKFTKESSAEYSKYGNYLMAYIILGLTNVDAALSTKHGIQLHDTQRALFLLSSASDQGLVEAHSDLAYASQINTAHPDLARVYRLYCQAADFGHPAATECVGHMLLRGLGTPVDKVAAARHLKVAAASGCMAALRLLPECEDAVRDASEKVVRATL